MMQGTQKEYPIVVVPFYIKKNNREEDKKHSQQKWFISDDLKVTGQNTHKIEPGNATGFPGFLVNVEWPE